MSIAAIVSIVLLLALVGVGVWLFKSGRWAKITEFVREVVAEVKRCSFPSWDEVRGTTIVVIITSFVFAIFLWFADVIIVKGYQGMLGVLGS
jgi:preprotein translocase subunit SecE